MTKNLLKTAFVAYINIFLCNVLMAQDVHFSQYTLAPLTLNPALTGSFQGTFRVGVLYRDQWAGLMPKQFVSSTISTDATLVGFGKRDWLGLGLSLVQDKAGSLAFMTTTPSLNVAYHLPLHKNNHTVLSFGVQGSFVQRRIKPDAAIFEDEILSGTLSQDRNNYQAARFADFGAGVHLRAQISSRLSSNAGFALRHLASGESSMLATSEAYTLPYTYMYHAGLAFALRQHLLFSPSFFYQTSSSAKVLVSQANFVYFFDKQHQSNFSIGGGYRSNDAAMAFLGFEYANFRVGFAYDFTTSSLKNIGNNRGSFELGCQYVARIFKRVKVEEKILCPRF